LGYKQMRDALINSERWNECVEDWKRETRRYAKRQLTWFRHQLNVTWIEVENAEGEMREPEKIAHEIARDFLESVRQKP